jgi:hypothetical protein
VESFEAEESHTTLVVRLVGGPYDGDEILMAPGDYSHAPPHLVAQPWAHPEHGGVYACYDAPDGITDWPEDPSGRFVAEYQFDGYRKPNCDYK